MKELDIKDVLNSYKQTLINDYKENKVDLFTTEKEATKAAEYKLESLVQCFNDNFTEFSTKYLDDELKELKHKEELLLSERRQLISGKNELIELIKASMLHYPERGYLNNGYIKIKPEITTIPVVIWGDQYLIHKTLSNNDINPLFYTKSTLDKKKILEEVPQEVLDEIITKSKKEREEIIVEDIF